MLCNQPDYSGLMYGQLGGCFDVPDLRDLLFIHRHGAEYAKVKPREDQGIHRCRACLGTGYWVLVLKGPLG